jgi:hypothetical protein
MKAFVNVPGVKPMLIIRKKIKNDRHYQLR